MTDFLVLFRDYERSGAPWTFSRGSGSMSEVTQSGRQPIRNGVSNKTMMNALAIFFAKADFF
jgi:hypothetical protein